MKVFELPRDSIPTAGIRLSMEEEIIEVAAANEVAQNLAADLADAQQGLDIVHALEDLAFVADRISQATPREAALIEIIGQAAVAGTDADGTSATHAFEDGEQKPHRIRETIDRFIQMIRDLMKTVVAKIQDFVKHVMKVSNNVQDRYDELKKLLETAEFKDGGTLTATYKVIPGYKYAEWDQLFKMIDEYGHALDTFVETQAEALRGASTGVLRYMIAKTPRDRVEALRVIETATRAPTKLVAGLNRAAVPEKIGENNAVQVQLGDGKMLLGGINFSVSAVKYRIGDEAALVKSNRHIVIGSDAAVVDVVRNIGNPEEKQMKVPNKAQLIRIVESLAPLVAHATTESKNKLLGAITTRADFHEAFAAEVIRRIEEMKDPSDEDKLVASGAQQALTKLSVGSTKPYMVMMQNTQRIISMVSMLVRESVEYRTKGAEA